MFKKNCSHSGRNPSRDERRRIGEQVDELSGKLKNISKACQVLGVNRSTHYDRKREKLTTDPSSIKRCSPRRLSPEERAAVLEVLNEDRFVDKAPAEIYASLLDEGRYLCSIRTMYRILKENQQVKERRNLLRHQEYKKPELLATAPNQVWSWDITKLRGPRKWTSYNLYVIIDIFSRLVVGWMVATRESGDLAECLIKQTCKRQRIDRNRLTIHSDRGAAMTSSTVAELLTNLGVTKSLNRPHVSDDNPFSESNFKT